MAITVGVMALLLVLELGCARRTTDGAELTSAADAGERLDTFLAGPLGSRAQAQRLIDAGLRHGRRRAAAQAPPRRGGRAGRGGARAAAERDDRGAERPSRSSTRTSTCSSSTSPPASSSTRRAGTAAARSPRRWPAAPPAARTRARRDRPPARPRHLGPARRRQDRGGAPRAAGARWRDVRSSASTSRSSRAARRRAAGTIDAPIGRDRRVRTRMSTDTDVPARRRARSSRSSARCPASALLRVRAGDRAHAPDPRRTWRRSAIPVAGDPEYGTRRPSRPRAPVPARRAARLRPSGHRRADRRRLAAARRPRGALRRAERRRGGPSKPPLRSLTGAAADAPPEVGKRRIGFAAGNRPVGETTPAYIRSNARTAKTCA